MLLDNENVRYLDCPTEQVDGCLLKLLRLVLLAQGLPEVCVLRRTQRLGLRTQLLLDIVAQVRWSTLEIVEAAILVQSEADEEERDEMQFPHNAGASPCVRRGGGQQRALLLSQLGRHCGLPPTRERRGRGSRESFSRVLVIYRDPDLRHSFSRAAGRGALISRYLSKCGQIRERNARNQGGLGKT